MKNYRKSVFVVVYSKEFDEIRYLVLERKLHWRGWEFPKGGVKENEKEEDAVKREVKEETGLNIKGKIKKFDIHGRYNYPEKLLGRKGYAGQSYSLYAVEINKRKITLDEEEHSDYKWLGFEDAIKQLKWKDQKQCLNIVNIWLENKEFRMRITKNGGLILGGKNETSNEELVKQSTPEEYLFHTAEPGSPFVNVKGKLNKEDEKEAAIFCARYSRVWKKSRKDVEVHKFQKKDVFKKTGMKKGTFGVKKFKIIKVKKEDIRKYDAPAGN